MVEEKQGKVQEQETNKTRKMSKGVLAGIIVVAIILAICTVIFAPSGKTAISVETALKEVIEISEFTTAEYTYNSIVTVKGTEGKKAKEVVKYYAKYKGTVKSGFDIQNVEIISTKKGITVVVPKIEVQDVDVDTKMSFIFTKKKYDTENTYQEAYKACQKDLKEKANNNKSLFKTAKESAIETLTALSKPFEKQLEKGQTIEVLYIDDYKKEAK